MVMMNWILGCVLVVVVVEFVLETKVEQKLDGCGNLYVGRGKIWWRINDGLVLFNMLMALL